MIDEVNFYPLDYTSSDNLKFAVILARFNGRWIFCKHKRRDTYEIPGGHREENELITDAAKRELREETGATEFDLSPICIYSVKSLNEETFGMLFYAEIKNIGELPESEIELIELFDKLPSNLTYPQIQPKLFERAIRDLNICRC